MQGGQKASAAGFRRSCGALAGCLVLGAGGVVTLAAWTDDQYASGTFTAGVFSIVGSVDSTTFSEHSEADTAAALRFTLPQSMQMAPGTDVYALFAVRTTSDSDSGYARFTADEANANGPGQHFRYGVRTVSGTTCDASAYRAGSEVIPDESSLGASATTSQPVAAAGSGVVAYCLRVVLPPGAPNTIQGTTVDSSWIVAASTEAPE